MAETKKQPLVNRLGFFVLGGAGSWALNYSILTLAGSHLHLPDSQAYALSVASTAVILFLWSYFVNFRTSRMWHDCLGRYLCAMLLAALVNYLIGLLGLKHFGSTKLARGCVVFVVQSFTGCIKFLLYHFWVFPHTEKAEAPQTESSL